MCGSWNQFESVWVLSTGIPRHPICNPLRWPSSSQRNGPKPGTRHMIHMHCSYCTVARHRNYMLYDRTIQNTIRFMSWVVLKLAKCFCQGNMWKLASSPDFTSSLSQCPIGGQGVNLFIATRFESADRRGQGGAEGGLMKIKTLHSCCVAEFFFSDFLIFLHSATYYYLFSWSSAFK